jgi:hypothetical protein
VTPRPSRSIRRGARLHPYAHPGPLPAPDADAVTAKLRPVRTSGEEHELYLSGVLRHGDPLVLAEVLAAFTSWLVEQAATQGVSIRHVTGMPAPIRTVPTTGAS